MSYWGRYTAVRSSRRRVLLGASGLALGGAALGLVGCGGGDDGDSAAPKDTSGLLTKPVDTTAQAKPGGVIKDFVSADVTTLDPIASVSAQAHNQIAVYAYPRLLKFLGGKYPNSPTGETEGDLAESYEITPDKLQLTLKLRQGPKWDPRPPTSSRPIDAQDVVQAWNRFARIGGARGDLVYNATISPTAPIESLTAPDTRTIVIKLHEPDSSIFGLLAGRRNFWIMPRESEGGFDPKGEVRGYGPWMRTDYRPSSLFVWSKFPDYHVKGRPFPDKIERPIVGEYAQRLAQFKTGNIYTTVATQEDVVQTKRDVMDALLRQGESYSTQPGTIAFGYEGDAPWKDERLRQAVSLVLDRELIIDVLGSRQKFAAEGLDILPRYHTTVGAGWDGFWLDPQDEKKFGANAKYYRYNVAEAKKLMAAAGFPNGVSSTFYYAGAGNIYGAAYPRAAQIAVGMLTEAGIRVKQETPEYANDWLPNYHYGYTQAQTTGAPKGFNGMAFRAVTVYPTPGSQMFSNMHSAGARFEGSTPDGKNAAKGDPEVDRALERIKGEFDVKKQQELAHEFQRMMAKKAYHVPFVGYDALGFSLTWPVIGNLGLYKLWPAGNPAVETTINWWVDESQPPISKKS